MCLPYGLLQFASIVADRGKTAVDSHRSLHSAGFFSDSHRCAGLKVVGFHFAVDAHIFAGLRQEIHALAVARERRMESRHVVGCDCCGYVTAEIIEFQAFVVCMCEQQFLPVSAEHRIADAALRAFQQLLPAGNLHLLRRCRQRACSRKDQKFSSHKLCLEIVISR